MKLCDSSTRRRVNSQRQFSITDKTKKQSNALFFCGFLFGLTLLLKDQTVQQYQPKFKFLINKRNQNHIRIRDWVMCQLSISCVNYSLSVDANVFMFCVSASQSSSPKTQQRLKQTSAWCWRSVCLFFSSLDFIVSTIKSVLFVSCDSFWVHDKKYPQSFHPSVSRRAISSNLI